MVDKRLNRTRASVISATALTKPQIQQLNTSLNNVIGKEILIETSVDESLLGGIILRIGDLVADASIRSRLNIMKRFIETEEVVTYILVFSII